MALSKKFTSHKFRKQNLISKSKKSSLEVPRIDSSFSLLDLGNSTGFSNICYPKVLFCTILAFIVGCNWFHTGALHTVGPASSRTLQTVNDVPYVRYRTRMRCPARFLVSHSERIKNNKYNTQSKHERQNKEYTTGNN